MAGLSGSTPTSPSPATSIAWTRRRSGRPRCYDGRARIGMSRGATQCRFLLSGGRFHGWHPPSPAASRAPAFLVFPWKSSEHFFVLVPLAACLFGSACVCKACSVHHRPNQGLGHLNGGAGTRPWRTLRSGVPQASPQRAARRSRCKAPAERGCLPGQAASRAGQPAAVPACPGGRGEAMGPGPRPADAGARNSGSAGPGARLREGRPGSASRSGAPLGAAAVGPKVVKRFLIARTWSRFEVRRLDLHAWVPSATPAQLQPARRPRGLLTTWTACRNK
mmetsp:Transcript_107138/g.302973  ORF Transcript_107138/g.302973 Transcript_107138/m.302973 type:complete len:278 (-) Transcript_107138:5-838(-)